MKRRERQRRMQWLFDEGLSRQEIFERYREEVGEEKQDQVAFDAASLVDTQRRRAHIGKIRIIVAMFVIQAVLSSVYISGVFRDLGLLPTIIAAVFVALIPAGLAYWIYRCDLMAYNLAMIYMVASLWRGFEDFWSAPIPSLVTLVWIGALLALTFYVRNQVFPHYGPFGLKREDSGKPCFPDTD